MTLNNPSAAVTAVFVAAATSYTANCALGAGVKSGVVDSRGFHWAHHAIYVATCVLSGAAVSSLFWGRSRDGSRSRAGLALLPAAIPLSLIPAISARSNKHVLLGLAVGPFIIAGLVAALKGR